MDKTNQVQQLHTAMDASGMGSDIHQRLNEQMERIAKFCANVQARATSQAIYNRLYNVPLGILTNNEADAEHAIKSGVVGAIGELVGWSISEALEFAADIAEDVNGSEYAIQIRDMAKQAADIEDAVSAS